MSVGGGDLNSPNLAKRLRKARRDRGLTQEAVANELGLARTSLVALEKGQRAVRPDELVAMARLYGRPIDELVRPTAPVEDFVGQFRTTLSRTSDATALEQAIRDVERYAEDYRELERLAGVVPDHPYPPAYSIDGLQPAVAANEIAATERNRLGLGDGPLPKLRDILETKLGIRVFFIELPSRIEGLFGFTPEIGACIAVNANHPAERQQWTMGHELAHFLTRRLRAEVTISRQRTPGRIPAHERFAESFSGEFLMPASGLTRDVNRLQRTRRDGVTPGALVEMAAFYSVSFQALLVRLEGLGLIPKGTFDMLQHERFSVAEARRLLGIPTPEPDTRIFPMGYLTLSVDNYRAGIISEGAFARFLRLDRVTAREVAQALGDVA